MRVLHCIETLQAGGAERQLTYLAQGLRRLGHEVEVAYLGGGPYEAALAATGARLHRIARGAAPVELLRLCRIVRARRPDVVQTWLGRMNVLGAVAGEALGRPWIFSERSLRLHDHGLRGLMRGLIGARAPLLVANSQAGARLWRRLRGRRAIEVVPNGLPLDEIARTEPADRAALGVPSSAELIVWAGRFVPAKNIEVLALALCRLLEARPRAFAIACGDGELRSAFSSTVARHGLSSRCLSPGHLSDVWALLKTADLLFLPSLTEGRPNVLLEAMAARCPVVLSDIAPHRELVPPTAARFFPPTSTATAVAELTAALDDIEGTRTRAEHAYELVRTFSIDAMVQAHLRLYQNLVEKP